MYSFIIILIITLLFILTAVMEFRQHQKNIYDIPIRIHVNGTRGKSSVARLIGAGLMEGGIPTITKITGTFPRLIIEDGREVHIYRKSGANIIEQLDIVRYARKRKVKALVIECMALDPQNQWITEHQMIHATAAVITNIRMDHLDVMGKTIKEIGSALSNTIPIKGALFSSDKENRGLLYTLADKKKSRCYISDADSVSEEELNRFTYIEHAENIALALDVCHYAGVKRSVALRGMYKVLPDPGALKRFTVNEGDKELIFYNAFAANDPHSSLMIWRKLQYENKLYGTRFVIINNRADRIDRAKQLAELVGENMKGEYDYVVLLGEGLEIVEGIIRGYGVAKERIVAIGITEVSEVYNKIFSLTGSTAVIVGIGNMANMGSKFVDYFEDKHNRQQND